MQKAAMAVVVASVASAAGDDVAREMTPAVIQEALADTRDICYSLVRPEVPAVVACISTPFTRVASVGQEAKARYETVPPDRVPAAALAPDLFVYAGGNPTGSKRVKVVAVVIAPVGGGESSIIRPTKAESEPDGSMHAVFPLSALATGNELRVVYDTHVCGMKTGRPECVVPFDLKGVR